MSSSNLLNTAFKFFEQHKSEIFTGISITASVTGIILTAIGTKRAIDKIEVRKQELAREKDTEPEPLSTKEVIKTVWTCYIPSVAAVALSTACSIAATSENLRRNAVLAAAYSLSETALKEYQNKTVEAFGEKKEQLLVKDSIAADKLKDNPVTKTEIFVTAKGDSLCYDPLSGRYFKTDYEKLAQAINHINVILRAEDFVSLNDFYYDLGLPDIDLGNDLGWAVEDGPVEFGKPTSKVAEDGTPCLVITYSVAPRYCYR